MDQETLDSGAVGAAEGAALASMAGEEGNEELTAVEEAAEEVANTKTQETGDQSPGSFYDRMVKSMKAKDEEADDEESEEEPEAKEGEEAEKEEEQEEKKDELKKLDEAQMDALVTMKIDGEEVEMPLKEALRISGLDKASHKRMREAKELQEEAKALKDRADKEGQQLLAWARQNPKQFLAQGLGIDPVRFAEVIVDEVLQWESMSDEEKRAYQLEQENIHLKHQNQTQTKKAETQANEQEIAQEREKLTGEIHEAMTEIGAETDDQQFFQAIARTMYQSSMNPDEKNLTAKEAAAKVKDEWYASIKKTLGGLNDESLEQVLGPEIAQKISEANVKRVTRRASEKLTQGNQNSPDKRSASSKRKKRPVFNDEASFQSFTEKLRDKY